MCYHKNDRNYIDFKLTHILDIIQTVHLNGRIGIDRL